MMKMEKDNGSTLCDMGKQITFAGLAGIIESQKIPGVTSECNAANIEKICSGNLIVSCSEVLDSMMSLMASNKPADIPADVTPKQAMCAGTAQPEALKELIEGINTMEGAGTCNVAGFEAWC